MRRLLTLLLALCASAALAQAEPQDDRRSQLDKAYEQARAAEAALHAAEAKRDQGVEPQEGERSGTASGGSRLNDSYQARQAALEREVEAARRRYEEALRRWNDLK